VFDDHYADYQSVILGRSTKIFPESIVVNLPEFMPGNFIVQYDPTVVFIQSLTQIINEIMNLYLFRIAFTDHVMSKVIELNLLRYMDLR